MISFNFDDTQFDKCRNEVTSAINRAMIQMINNDVLDSGSVTLKISIEIFEKTDTQFESDLIPMFGYKVTSQVPVKEETSGTALYDGMKIEYHGGNAIGMTRGLNGQIGLEELEVDDV